jgi:hypothetical protein
MMKELIAYHEAGHAVIARVLGITIDKVIVAADEGVIYFAAAIDDAEKDVLMTFAGPIAQGDFFHDPGNQDGWKGDLDHARTAILYEYGEESALEYYDELYAKAEALVAANWLAIKRVATALLVHRSLNQDDVDDLICRKH